ncbi:AAA family ATPase [Sinorhizobium medicae]|nr:AAA family ATPase [Sinorhizobium medicae]
MIKIDRGAHNPIPLEILDNAATVLQNYYNSSTLAQRQSRAPLDNIWQHARRFVVPELARIFHGKCAYCESRIGLTGSMEVDFFRPRVASDVGGSGSLSHYQWLAVEWGNMYPACAACNRAKRGIFPVEGQRANIDTPFERIHSAERALLIDPCRDDPQNHLMFLSGGIVHGITDVGETTIKILNLNREGLVEARRSVWNTIKSMASAGLYDASLAGPASPYSAAAHAAFADGETLPVRRVMATPRQQTADAILAGDRETFRLSQRPLKRVHLSNFKMIRDLEVKFPEATGEKAPWLVLLGENASGKSTLLQAIALALAGATEASRLAKPSGVLSHRANSGHVELEFWDNKETTRLTFMRGGLEFGGTRGPSATVRAFGALRHMERRSRRRENTWHPHARIDDLMRPIGRIEHPGRWLLKELNDDQFDAAARVLKDLLPLATDMTLVKAGNRILFSHDGASLPLTLASSGYQTVIGIAVEVMKLVFAFWDTLESATAIVLVDELDAHLHPRWKMRIVSALRTAFPNVQFIASTHDPLLLRGLNDGEVALMRRTPEATAVIDRALPPMEGMQVDEILTSRAFGLDTTLDPDVEALFDEYYYLLSVPRTEAVAGRIKELRDRLGDRESLGRNARENAMLKASMQFIEERGGAGSASLGDLNDETVRLLRSMFADTPGILRS